MDSNGRNVLERIRELYYSLSAAEQKVARYALENSGGVQLMSITELADAAGVSEATVTRFCRTLSLSGFAAFKLEIAKCTAHNTDKNEKSSPDSLEKRREEIAKEAKGAIDSTLEGIDARTLTLAVDEIVKAERVLCAGMGGGLISACECAHTFLTASPKFFALPDSHMQSAAVATMSERDLLILFSYSGSTVEGTELLALAKARGVRTLLVTRFSKSPSAQYADTVLRCGSTEGPYQMGSAPARIAQITVIDMLYREFASRESERESVERNVSAVADALSAKHA